MSRWEVYRSVERYLLGKRVVDARTRLPPEHARVSRPAPEPVSEVAATLALVEYQALYRKYRPQSFDQVVGQDHVSTTLMREVAEGRVAHAYLFAGPRGTGKTTSARILAKALNCQQQPEPGRPCNECGSCLAITTGTSFDVTELDAASHNSVDDIRDIRVSVTTVAAQGGKRVFILDEAHMLSKSAGNALLKTLEEPPDHVHFVLATTEPYKLLDTIRSRSQRFDFHPVGVEQLVQHLQSISAREGFTVDGEALTLVARHAKGSVRDSLSLLEQVAALGDGVVAPGGVNRALGLADRDMYLQLAEAIGDQDARSVLEIVARLVAEGADLRRFVAEAIGFLRGVFLVQFAPNVDEILDETPETIADWSAVAERLSPSDVTRTIDLLSEGLVRLREGREERLMTEMTLLKAVRPELAADTASVAARVEKLEQRINRVARDLKELPLDGGLTPAATKPAGPRSDVAVSTPVAPTEHGAQSEVEAAPSAADDTPTVAAGAGAGTDGDVVASLGDIERAWPALMAQVRDELGLRREALLREARPGRVEGPLVLFYVAQHLGFHLQQLREDTRVGSVIAEHAKDLLGATIDVEFVADPGTAAPAPDDDPSASPAAPLPDKNDLEVADAANDDVVALVEDILGGELIEDASSET